MRSLLALGLCQLALLATVAVAQPNDPPPELMTEAERSGYTRTMTSEQTADLATAIADSSPRVLRAEMGTSHEGRELPLLVIADPPIERLEDLETDRRLLVLLFGNIHAGEVCGKEALLMIARELALAEETPGVLEGVVVAIAPNYNPDGNDRFDADNRPGQRGPDRMGQRPNAQGLDLNRDHVKAAAPETRALLRFMRRYDPSIIVDTHTTNGSNHRYTITYQGPKHPAGDLDLIEFVRDTMLPRIGDDLRETDGYDSFFYGNFADNHTRWTTYPAEPRYGAAYRGMRNRISILSEAYAYASFEDRVLATKAFCEAILRDAAANADDIATRLQNADRRTLDAAESNATVALRVKATAFDETALVMGFQEYDEQGNRLEALPDDPELRDYDIPVVNRFVPTLEVERPAAYVIPADHADVIELLQIHGVAMRELREDVEVSTQTYRIDGYERSERAFQGHNRIRDVQVTSLDRTVPLPAGSMIVRTAQPLGSLAAYMLEPQSTDGLVAWNAFDEHLEVGGEFPVRRLPNADALLTRSARTLAEDRSPPSPITVDNLYGDRREHDRVSLFGGSPGTIRWLENDPEHYTLWRNNRLFTVHAATGRAEPANDPTDEIAARLASLDAISADDARRIASSRFARLGPDTDGVIFTHARDLYYAERDGSNPVRLTSTVGVEENAKLAPDGRFVSFVRDNNLWVVDVQTQTERAITTGGTDSHRFGKASWVYFEEVFGRNWNASWWSPDSQRLVYLETDDAAVPYFTIVDDRLNTQGDNQRIERVRYPRAGDPNPTVWAWIAGRAGGTPVRVDLSAYDPARFLITQIVWTPDSRYIHIAVQNRTQTWLDRLRVDARTGRVTRLERETTGAWVEPLGDPIFLDDGSYILRSERDGWAHLYHFSARGQLLRRLTEGEWEVRRVLRVNEAEGHLVFSGTRESWLGEHVYRISLDETEGDAPPAIERLTHEPGGHRATVNSDGSMFVDYWSSLEQPTRVALRNRQGSLVRMLDTNPVYEIENWQRGRVEAVQIPSEHGNVFEGIMIYPPDFDPDLEYPAWFSTYAGPHAPTVRDSWSGGRTWHHMLSQLGMIVLIADPYPASGKGAQSAWTAYRQLGVRELEDFHEIIAWLKAKPYVDADRVGMNGHSYGGFITAYAMTHSDLFAAGISGAPVTDWRDYDTIYTERYMGTPQDNPDGYRDTSAVENAGDLSGRLLLLHGLLDDNVHMANSTRFIEELQRTNTPFELMIYPGSRHGIRPSHVRYLMVDFMERTVVQDGPRPREPDASRESTPSAADSLDDVERTEPLGP